MRADETGILPPFESLIHDDAYPSTYLADIATMRKEIAFQYSQMIGDRD